MLENRFDITGQEDAIEKFGDDVLQQIINPVKDYEVGKFIHDYDSNGDNDLFIEFGFLSGITWVNDYTPQEFNSEELKMFTNRVKNSFFKFDFFNVTNRERQKLQFTKIIPMFLSEIDGEFITPKFKSNVLKNNEISDVFIFKNVKTKNINEFYFGCRFFNAANGNVVRMTNDPILDSGINPNKDYYYKLVIDRTKNTYQIFNFVDGIVGDRVGTSESNPLVFYQMI